MIVTFCGHSDFEKNDNFESMVLKILEENTKNKNVEFYLGGYGAFDSFAYDCCKKFQKLHPNSTLIYISPYLTVKHQINELNYQNQLYDESIYPELENISPRLAILYRNKYMVDKADFIIAYIKRDWGGAFKTYRYAQQKHKTIYNIVK